MGGLIFPTALRISGAFLLVMLAVPLCRRAALLTGLVDHPGQRKVHVVPIPYLGGLAILVGVAGSSLLFLGGLNRPSQFLLLGTGAACALGLLDDHRNLTARTRIFVETIIAVVLAFNGVCLDLTGVAAIDITLTISFILGCANALNLCDNMDGLAAGLALSVAACSGIIAGLYGDTSSLFLAGATFGGLAAYLVHNGPPATIFMGDSGSLMLGVLLAGLGCFATRSASGGGPGVAALLPFAIIFLDTTTVVVSRPRNGRKLTDAGKDHLSHRLALLGLGKERAVLVLFLHAISLGALGALSAAGIVPYLAAFALAGVTLATLSIVCCAAPVYAQPSLSPSAVVVDIRHHRGATGSNVSAAV